MESQTVPANGHVDAEAFEEGQLDPYSPIEKVTLGQHTYTVYEQKIGYLENRLKGTFGKLIDAELNGADLLGMLGGSAYKVLKVFIPKLMPEYEFRGFPTQEAFDAHKAGDESAFKDEYDNSPGPTQTRRALEAAMRVNSLDLFGHVRGFFSEKTRHAIVDELVVLGISQMKRSGLQLPSASVTTTPGAPLTTSGTTDPTSDETPTDGSASG